MSNDVTEAIIERRQEARKKYHEQWELGLGHEDVVQVSYEGIPGLVEYARCEGIENDHWKFKVKAPEGNLYVHAKAYAPTAGDSFRLLNHTRVIDRKTVEARVA